MITVATPRLCVSLPDRFAPGDELTAPEAEALERIFRLRLRSFVLSWLEKRNMTPEQVQINLPEFCATYEFTSRAPQEIGDPIAQEALRIAKELVLKELATKGIDLDDEALVRHATQVARLAPVQKRAEEIVALRQKSAQEALIGAGGA